MRRKRFVFLGVLLFFLSGGSSLFAQNYGTISGRVVDAGGAVVAGAKITATNTGTAVARSTSTNSDGLFAIASLNPGLYDVKAEATGFAISEAKGANLLSGNTLTQDFTMVVASVAQQVEVTSEAPVVETTTSEVSAALQQNEVQELPMLNRNVVGMLTLLPGPREPGGSAAGGPAHQYVVIGGSTNAQMMIVDGVDNHEDNDNGAMMTYSLEAIQEFKLIAHDFPAEYGKAESVVLLTTKGGTNQLHGSAFGYGRSSSLTKLDYFSDPAHGGVGKPSYSREQFGGSIGGPIIKDKWFYAGSTERILQNYFAPVPNNVYAQEVAIVSAFPGIDALSTHAEPQPYRDMMIAAKTNYQITTNNSMFLRYAYQSENITNSRIGTAHTLLASSPNSTEVDYYTTHNLSLGETWIVSPTTVNQFTAQFIHFRHEDRTLGYDDSQPLGACAAFGQSTCILDRMVFPSVSTGIYQSYIFEDYNRKIQAKDDVSRQMGKHAIKFGVDYGRLPELGGTTGNFNGGAPGSITWFNDATAIIASANQWAATPGTCTNAFAPGTTVTPTQCGPYTNGFQTPGAVRQIVETTENPANFGSYDNWDMGMYIEDDYKIKPRLTLNLGVRWDAYQFMNQTVTNPAEGGLVDSRIYQLLIAVGNPDNYGTLPQTQLKDFQPRIGFAWDIGGNGKNVLRASYGMFYWPGTEGNYYTANWFERPDLAFGSQFGPLPGVGVASPTWVAAGGAPAGNNWVYGTSPLPPGPGAYASQLPNGQSVGAYWYNGNQFKDQYEQQSHIGFSHEFSPAMAITADYTCLGIHEWDQNDVNPICTAGPANQQFQGTCGLPGYPTAATGQRPFSTATAAVYGDPNHIGFLDLLNSWGRSNFNELAIHFERRSNRVTFQINYDLSYAYAYGGGVVGGETMPEIPSLGGGCIFCQQNYGPGTNDERHRITVAGVFKLPYGVEISPTMELATARPYELVQRPNPDGDGSIRCFAGTLPVTAGSCTAGTLGSTPQVGINAGRGLPIFNLGARTTRTFVIHENHKIQAFAEFFNISDRANFGNSYGTSAASATFRQPTGYLGGSGGQPAGTLPNSFEIQFGARYSF